MATVEQAHAIQTWLNGHNVILRAPPGTGKSWTIMQACKERCAQDPDIKLLVIAYNTELAAELVCLLNDTDLVDRVHCYTFHGLCSNCIQLATDDVALERCINGATDGSLDVKRLDVDGILIDEAQDLNMLHLSLLRIVVDLEDAHLFVVGDPLQRLYDFGRFPALLHHLDSPEATFATSSSSPRLWKHCALTESRRITPQMALVVEEYFKTGLRSTKDANVFGPVSVQTCKRWQMGETVEQILKASEDEIPYHRALIAVTKKTGNVPLRCAINHLSSKGIFLYVQGVDGSDVNVRRDKLRVMSYHACKGTEADLVICFVTSDAKTNPLYVALTRARIKLHIVFVEDDAHEIVTCLQRLCATTDAVDVDGKTLDQTPKVTKSDDDNDRDRDKRPLRYVDMPRDCDFRKHLSIHVVMPSSVRSESQIVATHRSRCEDVSHIYVSAARMYFEHLHTGRVRAVEDCISPCRLDFSLQETAIRHGHNGRFVNPAVTDAFLIPPECLQTARESYHRAEKTSADWCTMAIVASSWSGYHHLARQTLPADKWVDEDLFGKAVDTMRFAIPDVHPRTIFDARLKYEHDEQIVHTRVHMKTPECAWHFVWDDIGTVHHNQAAVRALMHDKRVCKLLSLSTGELISVNVDASKRMAEAMLE